MNLRNKNGKERSSASVGKVATKADEMAKAAASRSAEGQDRKREDGEAKRFERKEEKGERRS